MIADAPKQPPLAPKHPVQDVHHDITRTDDYAWLRADNWQEVMPVREALKRLASERALTSANKRSFRVPELAKQNVADLFFVRSSLEGIAAELATPRLTKDQVDRLRALAAEMDKDIDREDYSVYLTRNFSFHFTIYTAAGNAELVSITESLWAQTGPFLAAGVRAHGMKAFAAQVADVKADGDHRVILTLKEGNADYPFILSTGAFSILPSTGDGKVDATAGVGTGAYMKSLKSGPNIVVNFTDPLPANFEDDYEDLPGRGALLMHHMLPFGDRELPKLPTLATTIIRSMMASQKKLTNVSELDLILQPPLPVDMALCKARGTDNITLVFAISQYQGPFDRLAPDSELKTAVLQRIIWKP